MLSISYENTTLFYRVSGSGDPVIFLHGFLENHSIWDDIAPEFVKIGYQVFLIDLPCHGDSRFHGEICTMTFMAQAVNAICKNESLQNPFVFGHSMGGYVGLELLKILPIQLTLLHSNFWADPIAKKSDRNRVIKIVRENKMRLIQEAIPGLFAPENRSANLQTIEQLILTAADIPTSEICASTAGMRDREDNTQMLEDHNIHIIHGEKDPIIPTTLLKNKIENLVTKPVVHLIKNCGHMSIWEKPETLINTLKLIVFK